jgi:hypothetical protein
MKDEMEAVAKERGYLYPAEKTRIKAIEKMIKHEQEKEEKKRIFTE